MYILIQILRNGNLLYNISDYSNGTLIIIIIILITIIIIYTELKS